MTEPAGTPVPGVPVQSDAPLPPGLLDAFWAYDRALLGNDVAALDRLFADSPSTLRGDGSVLAVGYAAISAFRAARTAIPNRRVAAVHVQVLAPDAALIVADVASPSGTSGLQTQLWRRVGVAEQPPGGGPDADAEDAPNARAWAVTAAHVSAPAPVLDRTTWRAAGAPLMAATGMGPLDGETVAVKDLYAIRGFAIGAGIPEYAATHAPEPAHADAVDALLAAGASVTGIAQTDQLAYSIGGLNRRFGAPLNVLSPNSIPGGSSSGSASAVARGWVSIGLGTDTAGSIRVPAAYQGLWSIRTTHGLVSRAGSLPLAESFDAVGVLTRSPELLHRATEALLSPAAGVARPAEVEFVASPQLVALASGEAAAAADRVASVAGAASDDPPLDLEAAFSAFRTVQAVEAWAAHGEWLGEHPGVLDDDVAGRFADASRITASEADAARAVLAAARAALRDWLGARILILPTVAGPAPLLNASAVEVDATRGATLRLTSLASLAGLPAVAAPVPALGHAASVCFVGAVATDLALIRAAAGVVASLTPAE